MDFIAVANYLPPAVVVAVALVIVFVYVTDKVLCGIERKLEAKRGKEIRIFEHKKIFISLFWCAVFAVVLTVAEFITLKEAPFYLFVIMGLSTFFYNAFIWKFMYKKKEDVDGVAE